MMALPRFLKKKNLKHLVIIGLGGPGGFGRGNVGMHAFEGQGQMLSGQPWMEEQLPHHNQDPKQLAGENSLHSVFLHYLLIFT